MKLVVLDRHHPRVSVMYSCRCGSRSALRLWRPNCLHSYHCTDTVIDAVESGLDPNHTDEVGQTLLNWACAFGTLEMVEYLCDQGADVDAGQRSSSLHYAACFGRVAITKVNHALGGTARLCGLC